MKLYNRVRPVPNFFRWQPQTYSCEATGKATWEGKVKFEITEDELRSRILNDIRDLRYPSRDEWGLDLVDQLIADFREQLRSKEESIVEELAAAKQIGLGMGLGPGGGPYSYVMIDTITPEFVRDIISQSEGRTFYDLMPQCCEPAADLFMDAWKKAVAEGLERRLFFRYGQRFYTDEALALQAKAVQS
jgi:hypothetical protein